MLFESKRAMSQGLYSRPQAQGLCLESVILAQKQSKPELYKHIVLQLLHGNLAAVLQHP
jgi:hypothetical protein